MKLLLTVVSVSISLPIWYYLMYSILTAIQASALVWFLYYVYVPFSLLAGVLTRLEGK